MTSSDLAKKATVTVPQRPEGINSNSTLLEHYSCPGIRLRHVPINVDLIAEHSLLPFGTRGFRLSFSGFICMSVSLV